MIHVEPLPDDKKIPKKEFIKTLEKEAPDFLGSLIKLELPPSNDRLNLPIIVTDDKKDAEAGNESYLETFIRERCYNIPGNRILFSDFYDTYLNTVPANEVHQWSKKRVSLEIPSTYPKGKCTDDPNSYIGNMTFDFTAPAGTPYVRDGIFIRKVTHK